MRILARVLSVFLLPSAALALGALPCVPDGSSISLTANPDLKADGIPVAATIVGDPVWYDKDVLVYDELGEGSTIEIENKGGNLSGPNGKVANGGLDGDCIEVSYKVLLRFQVKEEVCSSSGSQVGVGGSGISGSSGGCTTTTVWKSKWFWFSKGDVCAC